MVISFVLLGLWQLNRHGERADLNTIVASRSTPPAATLADVADQEPSELDYQLVTATGSFVDDDFVRVANRTQGGVAGQYLVGLFEINDGRLLLVNRGFVPLDLSRIELDEPPSGEVTITGWLRRSAEQGWLGAADTGAGDVAPRLDVAAIGQRLSADDASATEISVAGADQLIDVWLQQEGNEDGLLSTFPDPVPLPGLDGGPHLSYMAQWFIFATLGALFYGALLWRTALGRQRQQPTPSEAFDDLSDGSLDGPLDGDESDPDSAATVAT